jgi:isopentenyl diphosphate isomerase/L-lactate dehydrogenase-like FMN-dependent dehydrogenase
VATSTSVRKYTGTDREAEIYAQAFGAATARPVISLEKLEAAAREVLDARAFDYVAGGAGGERTMRANLEAFERWRIVPRMLRDVGERELSTRLLGSELPAPIIVAPVGVQGIVHREGELATARAAASVGVPFCLSTVASQSIEDVAREMGGSSRWFQLYWSKSRELTASMVRRAEKAGFSAIVVTLDTHMLAWRERDLENRYLPFLLGEGLANYNSDPVFQAMLGSAVDGQRAQAAIRKWSELFSNSRLTWDDLSFLREHTRLPIVLKGIQHPDDARRAIDAGVDAVIVSNHGGRQVDGAVGALDALPEVVNAISGSMPVLFDSGIRRGSDVFKALALGATAVLVGRPYVYGLAVGGEQGARDVLLNLIADFDLTLGLSGYTSCAQLTPEALTRTT